MPNNPLAVSSQPHLHSDLMPGMTPRGRPGMVQGRRFSRNADFGPPWRRMGAAQIKFRPTAVGHISGDGFNYSPNNPKSTSGSGLIRTGARGLKRGDGG